MLRSSLHLGGGALPWGAGTVRGAPCTCPQPDSRLFSCLLGFGFGVWGVVLGFAVYGLGFREVMMAITAEIKEDSCCHLGTIRGIMKHACFHSSRARDMGSAFGARLCSKLRLGCKGMVVLRLSWIQVGFKFKTCKGADFGRLQ